MIELPRAALTSDEIATQAELGHDTGLDYVSCSSFHVPVARLAAASATLK